MKNLPKSKLELIEEISSLKQRNKELEQSEAMHKQVEVALRISEAKFKEIFETIEDLYYETDSAGIVKILSPSLHCLTGWNEEDVIGKPATKVYVDPSDREQLLLKLSEKGYVHDYEVLLKKKNGEERQASLSARWIIDNNGQPIGVRGLLRDMTERKQLEESLKESEKSYKSLVENANEGIFVAQDSMLKYVNPVSVKIFGHSQNELTTKPFINFIHPEDRDMVSDMHIRRMRGEKFESKYGFRIVTENGITRDVEINSVIIQWAGKPASLGFANDITDRKKTEVALKKSENRYRELVELAVDGILVGSHEGIIIGANSYFLYLTGRTLDTIIGTHIGTLFSPSVLNNKPLRFDLLQKGEVVSSEREIVHPDGKVISIEMHTKMMPDGTYQSIYHDITSRKQAEEEIIREREKLKTLSDNAPFGMVLIDKEGYFTYINRKFTELFGYELSDVPDGRTWCRKAYPDAEYRHTIISAWTEDFSDARPGERKPRVFTVTCKDGMQKIVQLITSVLISGNYLMTCEDITEMRRLESQLRQAQKMEAIGTLAGGIAHDFNNILTALMGYASLVQMKMDTSDPLRSYMDEVLSASEKAVDLTQSLLAFSRQQSVTLVPLNINNTIKEVEKLLRRLLTEDIEFHTSLAEADMIVMADKSQMDQILFNLVTNARDAMPKGGTLTIETAIATIDSTFIKVHGFGEQGQYVRISLTDTGIGMDEITRSKIFDPFFTTKEVGKGTGLGLATVYGIIKQNTGYITVESTLNQGTTFHVYLPQVKMKVDEKEETMIPIKRGQETILIAEDNEGVRRYMREALQGHGYTITEAIDGEDAVRKFKENRDIHLIIIDSVMPKKNGREAYEEIHRIDPHVKVVFTSGYTKDIVLNKGIVEKEFDFIAKPLSLNKLLQKIREVLDK